MKFTLAETGSLPMGMIQVKGGRVYMSLGGLSHHGFMRLGDFLIDIHEVSRGSHHGVSRHGVFDMAG